MEPAGPRSWTSPRLDDVIAVVTRASRGVGKGIALALGERARHCLRDGTLDRRALAHELRPHGVAAVGVYPGFTRTEAVVSAFAAEGMEPPEDTGSPEYV